jgi:hypothetical protein
MYKEAKMEERISADIIVIGGGVAGVCAALAAARQGALVSLITNRPVLGGNSSSEIRVWTRGSSGGGNIYSEEMGILGELKMRNLSVNPAFNVFIWDEVLLDAVLAEKNIGLFLNTNVSGVELAADKTVTSVSGWQLASERNLVFTGRCFIDATGDGTIGARAGVPFVQGREGRNVYGESHAPEKGDSFTLGSSLYFLTRKNSRPVPYVPPAYIYGIEKVKQFISAGGRVVNETLTGCDYWWFEFGGALDTIRDSQDITLELKKVALGVWNYIKNSGEFKAENLSLEWVGSIPGKRESRRFIGAYVLKEQDVLEYRAFEDTVAYGGWFLDFHPPGGVYAAEDNCVQIPVFAYNIPLRSLYSRDVPNLFFAGRDISVSHAAFASSRIMDTCALTGCAAGTAAARACAASRGAPDFLPGDIAGIQQTLLKDGLGLLGLRRDGEGNLARQAKISVSSCMENSCGKAGAEALVLTGDWFLLVTKKAGAGFCEILFQSEQDGLCELKFEKQRLPSRLAEADTIAGAINIRRGENWTRIEFPPPLAAYEGFVMITGKAAPWLAIAGSPVQTTGFLSGLRWTGNYHYPAVRSGISGLYGPENLTDGYIRPWELPRSWISGEEKEKSVTFQWDEEKQFSELRLYLNPDFSREIPSSIACSVDASHFFTPRTVMPPELVKDYRVEVRRGGVWEAAGKTTDNWRAVSVFTFPKNAAGDAVRIIIESTYGSPRAEVFEIEIF